MQANTPLSGCSIIVSLPRRIGRAWQAEQAWWVIVAAVALGSCSSKDTASNCADIQKQCISAGMCLASSNDGKTSGSGQYGGTTGVSAGDEASCNISCVKCDVTLANDAGVSASGGAPTGSGGASTATGSSGGTTGSGGRSGTSGTSAGGATSTPDAGSEPADVFGCGHMYLPEKDQCLDCCVQALLLPANARSVVDPCVCESGACGGACAASECRKPSSLTTLPGDSCEHCLAGAMRGACASTWQTVCSDPLYAGPAGACDGMASCFTLCGEP